MKFVYANDKGLFFASIVLNRISFYQVGQFQNEYKPEAVTPTTSPEWTDGISYYSYNEFRPAGLKAFFNLDPGLIYRADKSISFSLSDLSTNSSLGTLSITKDSLFSIDNSQHPVLLKGQMTANFNSPATVYAIKFDRFEMPLFQTKLDQFIAGNLPTDEYFIVKNIHTKFSVRNNPNEIKVAVDSGKVQVLGEKIDKTIDANKQVTIDAKNEVQETIHLGARGYLFLGLIVFLAAGVLFFIFRNTKVCKKILHLLKTIAAWKWKTFKKIVIFIKKLVKKG